jgi:flagellar basal body-associated protein FliL
MEECCVFSKVWFKAKAQEILGNDYITLIKESPGQINLIVKSDDEIKFNHFKEIIASNKPLGVKVTIHRLNKETAQEVPVQEQPINDELVNAIGEKIAAQIASTLKNC